MKEKLSHLTNLVSIIYQDGKLHKKELDLLYDIADRYDIEESEVIQMLNQQEDHDFVIPEDPAEKTLQLKDLIEMMMVDGVISPDEMKIIYEIAGKFGFGKAYADDLVAEMKK